MCFRVLFLIFYLLFKNDSQNNYCNWFYIKYISSFLVQYLFFLIKQSPLHSFQSQNKKLISFICVFYCFQSVQISPYKPRLLKKSIPTIDSKIFIKPLLLFSLFYILTLRFHDTYLLKLTTKPSQLVVPIMSVIIFNNATIVNPARNRIFIQTAMRIIVSKNNGTIIDIQPCSQPCTIPSEQIDSVQDLGPHQLLLPGFIDTHIHAPQWAFAGTGLDLPLLQWLNKYTFPMESRFHDHNEKWVKDVYSSAVKASLSNGTTTACWFATLHDKATRILASIAQQAGVRAFVGKVCMDCNAPPYYVEESAEASLRDTEQFIRWTQENCDPELITPVITPRFAPTCTRQLLQGLGALAHQHDLPIQSHINQNKGEIEWVKELFPECPTYSHVYDRFGSLLGPRTVMAHCIYMSQEEIQLFLKKGVGVSHCPDSNINLQSGIMRTKQMMDRGMKISLGTDVAGGASPSILDAMRKCIQLSKTLAMCEKEARDHCVSLAEAFYIATMGGAQVMGMQDKVGCLEKGKKFDAQIWDYSKLNFFYQNPFGKDMELDESLFERVIYFGDSRMITGVWVNGKQVYYNNQ